VKLSLIVAVSENGCIGKDGDLPWRLPDDMKRFKALTMGKPIIMGRKTYESIGRALPGRRNIVVTRQQDYTVPECECVPSLSAALDLIGDSVEEACIIGGAMLYAEALSLADLLHLTSVHAQVDGDVYFPTIPWEDFTRTASEHHTQDERHAFAFTFETWVRK
jgi:dihydrofolate reductase